MQNKLQINKITKSTSATRGKKYIYKGKIPKLSIKNGCVFPKNPNELDLFNLEERFISPVMAFMLIHQLFPGGQFFIVWKHMSLTH